MILYSIDQTDAGESITCLLCQSTSHQRNDVEQRYCGRCHRFLGDAETQAVSLLTQAAEILRPDLSLEEIQAIVEMMGQICSPRLNPHGAQPQWSKEPTTI